MTTLKQIRDNMTDDKKLLLDLNLGIIKKIYGDNFTSREITKLSKEIMEDMTGISFDNNFKFTYKGLKKIVQFEVIVHYDDNDTPAYEVIEDVTHIHDNEDDACESNIVCFSSIKSVIDMFVTNTLLYCKE